MQVFVRMMKAVGMTFLIMGSVFIALALIAFTKGLFFILLVFVVLVTVIYHQIKWRDDSKRRRAARGW